MLGAMAGGLAYAAAQQYIGNSINASFNKDAFNMSKAWEKEKLTHAHQWTVQDMRAAGLNPMLAAGVTNSSGGLSQAQPANQKLEAMQSAVLGSQLDLLMAQADKEKALTRQADATAHNQWVQSDLNSANVDIQKALLPQVQSAAQLAALQNKFDIDHPLTWQIGKIANSAEATGNALSSFIPGSNLVKNVQQVVQRMFK